LRGTTLLNLEAKANQNKMSFIKYQIPNQIGFTGIPYNWSLEELEAQRRIEEIIRNVQMQNTRRSSVVNTDDYMELPLADDETETDRERETGGSLNVTTQLIDERNADTETEAETVADTETETDDLSAEELCHEITGKPVIILADDNVLGECAICMDNVGQLVNATTTRCGHTFHTSCLLRAMTCGAGTCPNCRAILVVKTSEDNSEEDESYDDEDDYTITSSDFESEVTLLQLSAKLQHMGYTFTDILKSSLMLEQVSINYDEEYYTEEFRDKLWDDIYSVLGGSIALSDRDTRSYLDVVRSGASASSASSASASSASSA